MSELPFVLIVYQICFRTVAPLCHSLRTLLFTQFSVSTAHGPDCTSGPRICLFAKFRRITSEVSATVLRFRRRESLRPQLRRRGSARNALYIRNTYMCRICTHFTEISLAEVTTGSDKMHRFSFRLPPRGYRRADSFRSIFYRYFEIQGAAAFFPKFDPHGLDSHFEILTFAPGKIRCSRLV